MAWWRRLTHVSRPRRRRHSAAFKISTATHHTDVIAVELFAFGGPLPEGTAAVGQGVGGVFVRANAPAGSARPDEFVIVIATSAACFVVKQFVEAAQSRPAGLADFPRSVPSHEATAFALIDLRSVSFATNGCAAVRDGVPPQRCACLFGARLSHSWHRARLRGH